MIKLVAYVPITELFGTPVDFLMEFCEHCNISFGDASHTLINVPSLIQELDALNTEMGYEKDIHMVKERIKEYQNQINMSIMIDMES